MNRSQYGHQCTAGAARVAKRRSAPPPKRPACSTPYRPPLSTISTGADVESTSYRNADAQTLMRRLVDTDAVVRSLIIEAQVEQKKHYDAGHRPLAFKAGDRVWLSSKNLSGYANKLAPRWVGPFSIRCVEPYDVYELDLPKRMSRLHPPGAAALLKEYWKTVPAVAPARDRPLPAPTCHIRQQPASPVHARDSAALPRRADPHRPWKSLARPPTPLPPPHCAHPALSLFYRETYTSHPSFTTCSPSSTPSVVDITMPPALAPVAGLPWATGQHTNVMDLQMKRFFAANLCSVLIEYADKIDAAGGSLQAAAFPHAQWAPWFSAGNNPTADYATDPRAHSDNPTIHADTVGMMLDNTRVTRSAIKFCGAEFVAMVPSLRKQGGKLHLKDWSDNTAQTAASYIVANAVELLGKQLAYWNHFLSYLPANHALRKKFFNRNARLKTAHTTLKAIFLSGAKPAASPTMASYPCIMFFCLMDGFWVVIGVLDAFTVIPPAAHLTADPTSLIVV